MRRLSVGAVFLVGACASAPPPTPPSFASCAAAAAYYQARKGEALVQPVPFKPHRVIPPDSAVTMDYNPVRLNVYTDKAGRVSDARCG